jgi:hypothetical protein
MRHAMTSVKPALLVVTGLRREAQIAAGEGVVTLCSGGGTELLRDRLSSSFSVRPRQGETRFTPSSASALPVASRRICSPGDIVIASHVLTDDVRHDVHERLASGRRLRARTCDARSSRRDRGKRQCGDERPLAKLRRCMHRAAALAVDMESHIAATNMRESTTCPSRSFAR